MFNGSVLKKGIGDYYAPLWTWASFASYKGRSRKYSTGKKVKA